MLLYDLMCCCSFVVGISLTLGFGMGWVCEGCCESVMVVFLLTWEGAFPSFSHYYTRSIACEFTVITILVFCFVAKDADADAQRCCFVPAVSPSCFHTQLTFQSFGRLKLGTILKTELSLSNSVNGFGRVSQRH